MQELTFEQIAVWLKERYIAVLPDGRLQRHKTLHSRIRLGLPRETHKLPLLARDLVNLVLFNSSEHMLFWVCEWRIRNEEIELIAVEHFERLRATYGRNSALEEFPGHELGASEKSGAIMFTLFPLLFSWDTYLVGACGTPTVFISHDEFVQIELSDAAEESRALELLKAWEPTLLESPLPE